MPTMKRRSKMFITKIFIATIVICCVFASLGNEAEAEVPLEATSTAKCGLKLFAPISGKCEATIYRKDVGRICPASQTIDTANGKPCVWANQACNKGWRITTEKKCERNRYKVRCGFGYEHDLTTDECFSIVSKPSEYVCDGEDTPDSDTHKCGDTLAKLSCPNGGTISEDLAECYEEEKDPATKYHCGDSRIIEKGGACPFEVVDSVWECYEGQYKDGICELTGDDLGTIPKCPAQFTAVNNKCARTIYTSLPATE